MIERAIWATTTSKVTAGTRVVVAKLITSKVDDTDSKDSRVGS